jgi:hypothetical protein
MSEHICGQLFQQKVILLYITAEDLWLQQLSKAWEQRLQLLRLIVHKIQTENDDHCDEADSYGFQQISIELWIYKIWTQK